MKIISGAQTGVDRAALDAALELGIDAGGWCPEGRKAEDGIIPDKYSVQALKGAGYRQRTRKNVTDSDGAAIIYFGYPQGLAGEEILLESRILAVADMIESISSHRPYRPALDISVALKELNDKRGIWYDPDIVDACLQLIEEDGLPWG